MAYKTILCHLFNDEGRNVARWETAFAVSSADNAHVVGLYTIPPLVVVGDAMMQLTPTVYEQYDADMQKHADRTGRQFLENADRNAISAEWRVVRGFPNEALRMNALYADLIVMGHASKGFVPPLGMNSEDQLIADVAIQTGRPVLALPQEGSFTTIGKRVLLAWNDSRESARALTEALPLLTRAEAVSVVTGKLPSSAPAQYVSAVLVRHGVKVEMHNVETSDDPTIGALLLHEAERRRCDVIVMGIYGRSRMNEWVFGGVSRYMLRHARIPILFAH